MRPFILIALLAAGIFVADTSQAEDPAALPACDANQAIESVKEAIANNAFKNIANVQVLDYDKLSEVSFDAKEGVRACIGDFVLNTGDETIAYSFKQAKSDPTKVLVQVQALDRDEALGKRLQADEHNLSDGQKDRYIKADCQKIRADEFALCLVVQSHHQQAEEAKAPKDEQHTASRPTGTAVKEALDRKDYQAALKLLRPLADQGNTSALFLIGEMNENGEGVKQDYVEAMKWFRKAADQGLPEAQYNIGIMYANGKGVTRDYSEAMKWLRKSADQGLAEAQYNVGVGYDEGLGVQHDDAEANKWFQMAAQHGNKDAQHKLEGLSGGKAH